MRKIKQSIGSLLAILSLGVATAQNPATELVYPKPQDPVELGTSIAIYDQYVLAGTEFENDVYFNGQSNTYHGAIRLFKNNQYIRTYTFGGGATVGLAKENTTDIGQHCIVAGAPFYTIGGERVGVVQLANRLNNGTYHTTLNYGLYPEAQDVEKDLDFGYAVSTDNDWIAIGARGRNGKKGGVYMFQRVGYWQWARRGWLPTPSLPSNGYFGQDVNISGNQMIVSGRNNIYIYELSNGSWSLTGQAAPPTQGVTTVSISNNHAVAGSGGGGPVAVYRKSWNGTWSLFQTITGGNRFGQHVAVSNQNLIISNNLKIFYYQLQNNFNLIGSMYIPSTNPSTGRLNKQRVGFNLDIHGDRIAASAINTEYVSGPNEGAVFTDFFYNGWANSNHLRRGNSEEDLISEISVFPNPSTSDVYVNADGDVLSATATSALGKSIALTASGRILHVQDLSAGMYMLQIETTDGTFTTKFIKE